MKLASKLVTSLAKGLVYRSETPGDYVDTFIDSDDIRQVYGLDKLVSTHSGPAIRVRRSSDNTEQDIGFVNAELDSAELLSFAGAGSAFVVTWYDQSANGDDITQSTASLQPRIVNSGVYDEYLIFDGVDDLLLSSSVSPIGELNATIFLFGEIEKTGTGSTLTAIDGGAARSGQNGWFIYYDPRVAGIATPAYSFLFTTGAADSTIENIGIGGTPTLDDAPKNLSIVFERGAVIGLDKVQVWIDGTFHSGNLQFVNSISGNFDSAILGVGGGFGAYCAMRLRSLVICANDNRAVRANVEALL